MLRKKMFRDLLGNKGSYLACLVIVLIGLIVFTAFSIARDNLSLAKEMFYREQNFADGFVELESMPRGYLGRLARVEGVREISGRLMGEVRVHDPAREESVYLKVVSLDLEEPRRVNDARLLKGEELTSGRREAWIDNQFFDANRLELYQELEIIAGGRVRTLILTGVGMSPEFTYPLRDLTEIYPNPEQFGIAFIPLQDMDALFPERRGTVNDLAFTLEPGADFERVKERLEPRLEPYGLKTIYPRDDQISHLVLTEELIAIDAVSTALPVVFLIIAGIILYIMLKRLVEQQRSQIGILKAIGYTDREVVFHYLSYALIVGSIGGLAGGILGIWLSLPLTHLLMEFFNVPRVYDAFASYYLVTGVLMSVAVFLFAGYQGCRPVLRLKPAEALRPPAPPSARKTLLEKLSFFWNMLTIQGMMAVRNLSRKRGRSAFMFLGIMLSSSVVALTWSFNELADLLVFYHYEEVETYDAKMTLRSPAAREPIRRELDSLPQVVRAEPLLEIPATLAHGWREEDVLLLGIPRDGIYYNILDAEGRRVAPSERGLILSDRLAEKLEAPAGSTLELSSPLMRDGNDTEMVPVQAVIPQYMGMNAYMEIYGLENFLGQGKLATSFLLGVGGAGGQEIQSTIAALRDRYAESEIAIGVDGREERIRMARELMETFGSVIYLYVFIGLIICFSIIYSSSFIILSERNRELASMRVLGMTSREVFSVITFEQWFISIFAIVAGLPLAQLMHRGLANEMSTDLYSLPGDISPNAFFAALAFTALSIWIAQRFALKKVEQLSLVEVLKTGE